MHPKRLEGAWPSSIVRRPPWLYASSVKNKTNTCPHGFSDLPTALDVTTKLEESHNATVGWYRGSLGNICHPEGCLWKNNNTACPPIFSNLPTALDITTKLEESHNATCIPRDPTNAKAIYHCSNTINFKPQNEMWESDLFLFYLPTAVFIDSMALLSYTLRACMYVFWNEVLVCMEQGRCKRRT